MRFQQGLQIKLQEHYRRVNMAEGQSFGAEVRYLCEFIATTPALRLEMEVIQRSEPDFDPVAWLGGAVGQGRVGVTWPETSASRLKGCWHVVRSWQDDNAWSRAAGLYFHGGGREVSPRLRKAASEFVEPICHYLIERLGEASDVLYILERYCRRTAWFTRLELFEHYQNDTAHGEEIYDSDLRRFLFEEGIDFPYPKPRSASGEADLVANLENGDDPLICEVKLFDGGSYGRPYLAKGFNQAISYARDYGKHVAYLVIFNLTDKLLRLPSDGSVTEKPPRIEEGGVTVYLVEVHALPVASASTRGRAQTYEVTREQLVAEPEQGDPLEG